MCVNSKRIDDIFNLDPDEVLTSEVGVDFYEMRKRLQSIPVDINNTMTELLSKQNYTSLNLTTKQFYDNFTTKGLVGWTTEKIRLATLTPETAASATNTTLRDIKKRRSKLQLEKLLNTHRSVSDYLADSDLDSLTRKFDQMVEENKKNTNLGQETRREYYIEYDWRAIYQSKTRFMNLITHFTYITRYKLVYPQVLRKKYLDSPQYKIGFLFALLRHLKNMQKWIYWKLTSHGDGIDGSIYYDIKMFEKILRLDVDIKDAELLLRKMEYHRNLQYNPKYYDYSVEQYD
ncbi:hypothetical protein PYW07_014093 [Mythimna separata]|uniref:Uncharacterized protein n=1 Tax=Mythimna separata TaxID=271217 RepID=A0AAD7YFZ6_MYTSE|nr:hypothetical protein PYW07_014093 [Mythimna separata]